MVITYQKYLHRRLDYIHIPVYLDLETSLGKQLF